MNEEFDFEQIVASMGTEARKTEFKVAAESVAEVWNAMAYFLAKIYRGALDAGLSENLAERWTMEALYPTARSIVEGPGGEA